MKVFERYFPLFLLIGILINANGLLNDILEPDGALYATIAKHIALTGEWSNLYGNGDDWLDKPHFPFWITAALFKVFGINAFAYKLPAFLFWLAGLYYIYALAQALFSKYAAKVAVIIYVFCLHGILNNFDIRAEPYLTTLSIAAIYYFFRAQENGKFINVVLAAFMSACAIMTKGIFVLITIGGGLVIYWIKTKQWKQFIHYRWWVMVILILLFITPEVYSLYVQFDLHPEKIVFDRTNVSGVKFFFWDSQFGRFFNSGPIKGDGDPTFFLHTTLWAFMPWAILLYLGIIHLIRFRHRDVNTKRWVIYGSAAITFVIFSLSKFQLPHYIVLIFPHFAIITAAYLTSISREVELKRLAVLQAVLLLLAVVFVSALAHYSGFGNVILVSIISMLLLALHFLFINKTGRSLTTIIATGISFCLIVFVYLHNLFYPRLLHYQSGMMAGKYIRENNMQTASALFSGWSYTFEFYAPGFVATLKTPDQLDKFIQENQSHTIYTSLDGLDILTKGGYKFTLLKQFDYFAISMLNADFLNPKTRRAAVEKMVLITGVKKS